MKQNFRLRRTLSALIMIMTSAAAWAYDFGEGGLYYDINDDSQSVTVTYELPWILGGAYSAKEIIIPASVTHKKKTYSVTNIGDQAFTACKNLTSISIPEGVTSIGEIAFSVCAALTSVSIPESVTSIKKGAFGFCTALTSISIPEGVTRIRETVFSGCTSLATISLPKGVTIIEDHAFSLCTSLASISIPAGVTSIGENAFAGCVAFTSVTCLAEELPELGKDVFAETPVGDITLYVPASALEKYKAADQWKDFGKILPIE